MELFEALVSWLRCYCRSLPLRYWTKWLEHATGYQELRKRSSRQPAEKRVMRRWELWWELLWDMRLRGDIPRVTQPALIEMLDTCRIPSCCMPRPVTCHAEMDQAALHNFSEIIQKYNNKPIFSWEIIFSFHNEGSPCTTNYKQYWFWCNHNHRMYNLCDLHNICFIYVTCVMCSQ